MTTVVKEPPPKGPVALLRALGAARRKLGQAYVALTPPPEPSYYRLERQRRWEPLTPDERERGLDTIFDDRTERLREAIVVIANAKGLEPEASDRLVALLDLDE